MRRISRPPEKYTKNAKTIRQAILKVVRRNSENLSSSNKKQSKFGHWYFTGNFIGDHKPAREKRVLTISTPKSSKHKGLWLSPIKRTATPQRGKSCSQHFLVMMRYTVHLYSKKCTFISWNHSNSAVKKLSKLEDLIMS